jgi:signal transduction histidine kinase/FixJ family two-component response regulator
MAQAESFFQTGQEDNSSAASASFLVGGGEMGERIRAFEWENTPLGPVEQWPQSLLTLVATSIRSRFPIVIWWDSHYYAMLYNDAYISFLGKTKHPGWLGRSGRECWKEIWPTIGPMLESVFETGQPTWSEDLLLVLDRNLPREEAYFTFSYSAIPGAADAVDGIFCACAETTERVIGERRLKTLRDLASSASQARSAEEACEKAASLLAYNTTDIPFALIYLLDRNRTVAHLVAHSGVSVPDLAETRTILLSSPPGMSHWPFDQVAREATPVLVSPLPGEWGMLPAGPWPKPSNAALVLPMFAPGQNQVTGLLVVGVNPRRELDESYRDFFQMVAGHVATAVANARAYEEERRRAEALAELDRAKTLFFSNISHEFRTPLTLMLGPTEDLLTDDHALSAEQRDQVEILKRNTLRLLRLVNTLLDFSRIEAGRIEAVYEPVDLAALTADLASNFRSAIEKAGMILNVKCPSLEVPVYVDQQMWEKIVLNLLSNAFKYTLQGTITVAIEQKEMAVELSVQDTGVGIPAEELPHMFERFHRVRGTEGRTFEGTGIGLSLVHELVKLHGGTIRVESTRGQGSTFTVSLPLGMAHLPAERIADGRILSSAAVSASTYVEEALQMLAGQEAASALLTDMPLPAGGTFSISRSAGKGEHVLTSRILFADDNADMRDYVSRLLRPRYEVQVAPDGRTALAMVREYQPDLVLADVMMPGMDGFELLQTLRSNQETSNMPVILLSARAGEEAQVEGLQAGADDYLIKPFSARELLARVGAHVEMARLRKEAEERIQAERQRLYDLFMQAPAAVVILRGSTYVVELANPTTLSPWGRTREQVLGKPLFEALPEIREQGLEPLLEGVLTTGIPYVGQEQNVPLDRSVPGQLEDTYFTFVYAPLRNARQAIEGIMVFAYDVTEQVRARQRSEELSRQKDVFLGIASHELKTPVTSLKGFTQLLERRFRNAGDEGSAEMLKKMDVQLNKLTSLVEDLLNVTKMESGHMLLHPSLFEMNALISEIVEETQRVAGRHRIVQELGPYVTLYADRERIEQVLTNLLTNAIKYSPQADTIVVKTVCSEEAVIVSVQDYGIGIAKEKQSHLFERFYRVEGDSQLTYPGLGLGLYIAAEFVKRHQGSIWVESEPGKGTMVSFSLPLPLAAEESNG